jgi:hypothetical protein
MRKNGSVVISTSFPTQQKNTGHRTLQFSGLLKKAQIHAVHPPSICDSLEAIANAEVGSLAEVMQIITNLN